MQNNSSVNLMTEGNYKIKMLKFAVPVFFGNLFQTLYTAIDSVVVGNYIGPEALAAISSNANLTSMMVGMFMGFGTGVSVVVGQSIGKGDKEKIGKAVHSAISLGILLGLLATVFGITMGKTFLQMMGTPAEVIGQSVTYIRIYFGGSLAMILYNVLSGILQASGDSKDPLKYLIISSIVNTVVDILFVAVLHLGIGGAALATVLSQVLCVSMALRKLMNVNDDIRVSFPNIRFDGEMTRKILKIGFPSALQWTLIDLSNVIIQSYINSFGTFAMAGYGAATRIEGFTHIPIRAMEAALITFVSQNYGAKNYERIKKGIVFGVFTGVVVIECIGTFTFIFANQLVSIFNSDPEVMMYGVTRLRTCAFFFGILGFSNMMAGTIEALGKPLYSTLTSLICWCGLRVLVLNTIGRVYHFFSLSCIIYPITWTLSASVFAILYFKYLRVNYLSEDRKDY